MPNIDGQEALTAIKESNLAIIISANDQQGEIRIYTDDENVRKIEMTGISLALKEALKDLVNKKNESKFYALAMPMITAVVSAHQEGWLDIQAINEILNP